MLYNIIKKIFPGIKDTDFSIFNDGSGEYIKEWLVEGKPTQTQLDEAISQYEIEILKEQAIKKLNAENYNIFIQQLYDDWKTKDVNYKTKLTEINTMTKDKLKEYLK